MKRALGEYKKDLNNTKDKDNNNNNNNLNINLNLDISFFFVFSALIWRLKDRFCNTGVEFCASATDIKGGLF